ncbi:crooked neck protein, putative [Actinidia rufa]|uniref:Crooked neck protein, putative n=1 Tax=Actinidia rufa TaxID=165716 RepID=A0A7J0EEN1_9ERIC|nr:crooked neck protein, putative [Actinidia rufa]
MEDFQVSERRFPRVKNKSPAPIQIKARQILHDARQERDKQEADYRPPEWQITDQTELQDYRTRKRKQFETVVCRVGRIEAGAWVNYARWEESHADFASARSVWERALVAHRFNHTLYLKYAEFEMKNKFVNRSRNIWDRAIEVFPRIDQVWYKYIHMEQMLRNFAGARQIFERWMEWEPDLEGWLSYVRAWIRYAKFEMKSGEIAKARSCYERAVENLAEDEAGEEIFLAFAEFEELCKETERARFIYRFALDRVPKNCAEYVYGKFITLENVILAKKGLEYEDELNLEGARRILGNAIGRAPKSKIFKEYIQLEMDFGNTGRCRKLYEKYLEWSPQNCYAWMKYADLEILSQEIDRARAIFELAISQPALDKPEYIWKKYIDFELKNDHGRARELYERLLERTKHITVWISYAMTYALELKEERAKLLDEWEKMESGFGELGDVESIRAKQPRKIKRRRHS